MTRAFTFTKVTDKLSNKLSNKLSKIAIYHSATRHIRLTLILCAGIGYGTFTGLPGFAQANEGTNSVRKPEISPLTLATEATARLAKGDYAGASGLVGRALRETPGDANLHVLAGTILLRTGDGIHAHIAFQNAVTCDPANGMAIYGKGLAQLACGDRTGALQSFTRADNNGADRSYTTLARNYVALLAGARIAVAEAGFPPGFASAQQTLTGINALQRKDFAQAQNALLQAQSLLPGDPIVQPDGILMTFDTARPLMGGAPALPKETVLANLAAPLPTQRGLNGTVQITPENVHSAVAYVTFDIDGHPQGIMNAAPYTLLLDTRSLSNGWHDLVIATYDRSAVEINRINRRIRIFNGISASHNGHNGNDGRNGNDGHDGEDALKAERLQGALWSALTLLPDRYACAYSLGMLQQQFGNLMEGRRWFGRACALRPDSLEARRGWQLCGGASIGAEAMWGGLPDEKVIAFTFDDGPKPGLTEPLLELLTRYQIPATFFVIGRHVMEYPDLTRQIYAAGMEIANHSYTHRNLTRISGEEVAREVMATQAAVEAVTGKAPRYLRPPGGNWNGTVASIVRQWGLTPCMWTVDVYGSEVIGAQQVADAVLAQVRPGSVVLMHNGKLSTLQALPTIIKELRARGYTFATVDALAKRLAASKEAARRATAIYAKTRHSE